MKPYAALIIVMPVGPASSPAFVTDTLESIEYYVKSDYKIIIADDSRKGTGEVIRQRFPGITVLQTKKNYGRMAGLYINLSQAYKYALDHYKFDVLLKIDDDALITGPYPEAEAIRLFREYPDIGMAGRHFSGKYSPDSFGNTHDNSYPRNTLLTGTCTWKFIRRPVVNLALRKLFFKAVKNGYEIGENIFGGAYFMSERCLTTLDRAGYLPLPVLQHSILGEDHLFSLLVHAVGLRLADLAGDNLPLGVAWQGLPASPETIRKQGKKIIHSTRYWQQTSEQEIRAYFQQHRSCL